MSFGFGIGDIIECTKIAAKTYDALKSAPKEFDAVRLEVGSLNTSLKALADEFKGPTSLLRSASSRRREDLRLLLESCENGMEELRGLVYTYPSLNSREKKKLLDWMEFAARNKQGPRDKIAIHTASINMFLTTLSHGSLGRLEFLLKNPRQNAMPATNESQAFTTGTKGLKNPAVNPRANGIWADLGRDLAREGIQEQEVVEFQEELKAYMRYLVRGETPFWQEPGPVRTPLMVERERLERSRMEERDQSIKKEEIRRPSRASASASEYAPDSAKLVALERDIAEQRALMERQRAIIEHLRKEIKLQEGPKREQMARSIEDARRREKEHATKAEELAKQRESLSQRKTSRPPPSIRYSSDPFTGDEGYASRPTRESGVTRRYSVRRASPEIKRARERDEDVERSRRRIEQEWARERERMRKEERERKMNGERERIRIGDVPPLSPGAGSQRYNDLPDPVADDKVTFLIKKFDGLFDLDESRPLELDDEVHSSTSYSHSSPGGTPTASTTGFERKSPSTWEPAPSSVSEIRRKLADLTSKRKDLIASGETDRVIDLETYVIPETVELLRGVGVRYPDKKAWLWHQCDYCQLPIVDVRFHCYLCQDGDWDVCRPCHDKGISCLDSKHPRLLEILLVSESGPS